MYQCVYTCPPPWKAIKMRFICKYYWYIIKPSIRSGVYNALGRCVQIYSGAIVFVTVVITIIIKKKKHTIIIYYHITVVYLLPAGVPCTYCVWILRKECTVFRLTFYSFSQKNFSARVHFYSLPNKNF